MSEQQQTQPPDPPLPPPPAPMPAPVQAPALGRGWLRALLQAIRDTGVQPRDPRVKALWQLLRRRQLLARSPWARTRLKFIWQKGLNARPRPRTIARLLALLRNRGPLTAGMQRRQWSQLGWPRRTLRHLESRARVKTFASKRANPRYCLVLTVR